MQFLLLDPLLASADRAGQNLAAANWQGLALSQQLIEAGRNSAAERHEQLLASRAAMEASVRAVDHAIEEHAASLVAPEVMPVVLRRVLSDTDLTLLELSNEPPVALLQIGDASADAAAPTAVNGSGEAVGGVRNLYRHGLTMRLEGSYADAVRYLQDVEALPWRFIWEEMTYEVQGYPDAVIKLRLETLSTDPDWFGVSTMEPWPQHRFCSSVAVGMVLLAALSLSRGIDARDADPVRPAPTPAAETDRSIDRSMGDPTAPLRGTAVAVRYALEPSLMPGAPRPTSIIHAPHRRMAIIDGVRVRERSRIGDYEVSRIGPPARCRPRRQGALSPRRSQPNLRCRLRRGWRPGLRSGGQVRARRRW